MLRLKAFFLNCCVSENKEPDTTVLRKYTTDNEATRTKNITSAISQTYSTRNANGKLTKSIKISLEDIISVPVLTLTVIDGKTFPAGTEIVINAGGLAKGGRGKKDGITYFGSQKYKISTKNSQQKLMNDVLLNDETVGMRHSMLKYNPMTRKYALKDLGDGSGTFIKVENKIKIKSGYIMSFSDSHVLLSISEGIKEKSLPDLEKAPKDALTLKFLDGPKLGKKYNFLKENSVVKVGRMNDCAVKFEGNSLSRYQCAFEYIDNAWYLSDGWEEKPSTNGTWLFLEEFYEIKESAIIKIGQTLFRASLRDQITEKFF